MKNGLLKKANADIILNSILPSVRWLYDWYYDHQDISPIELEIQIINLLVNGFKAD